MCTLRLTFYETLTIYSARKEALILPLLKRFKEDTGIYFRLTTGTADGLLKRLEIEGQPTPADVFITVDAGRLQRAKDAAQNMVLAHLDLHVAGDRTVSLLSDTSTNLSGMAMAMETMRCARWPNRRLATCL